MRFFITYLMLLPLLTSLSWGGEDEKVLINFERAPKLVSMNENRLCCILKGLQGNVPPEIGTLINLQRLDLFNNQLSGSIPLEIGNLINLQQLDLCGNYFSGPTLVKSGI